MSEWFAIESAELPAMDAGDLLIGRVFPIDQEDCLLSPAVSCIRDEALVAELELKIGQLRASRRGVLRIQQSELERLFFQPGASTADPPAKRSSTRRGPLEWFGTQGAGGPDKDSAPTRLGGPGKDGKR